ncbi:MAG: DUF3119 family protein [Microcoleaceae cyanobacterium MO_207.B10]|nr:DUF3119 family protein [Microcoleaceae cyanobacterium MO_207.B10]
MTTTSTSKSSETIELAPSYKIPLVLIVAALPLAFWQKWLGLAIAVLGLFLLFQATTLRLKFTDTALEVYLSEKLLRHFPYQDWLNWEIFWSPVPILFYFREVKSIHLLPIIFDPEMLKTCLEKHISQNQE